MKKEKMGYCNICGYYGKLTEDHVPPKFWNNTGIKDYALAFGTDNPRYAEKYFANTSRNGIVFNTVCCDCNNRLLGSMSDQVLKGFIDVYKRKLNYLGKIRLPMNIEMSVNKVARAVVGHMLAAKKFYDTNCIVDKKLREYLLNSERMPPSGYMLCFYPYPYTSALIARDVVLLVDNRKANDYPDGMISVLASYPIAFVLLEESKHNTSLGWDELFHFCSSDIDRKVTVNCKTSTMWVENRLREPDWPLHITEDENGIAGIMAGQSKGSITFAKSR